MPAFVKMGIGGTGYLGKKQSTQRAAHRYLKRRAVKKGYPVLQPFASVNDVKEYLSGDRITCLICGRSFKHLGPHIKMIHRMTVDDYKEYYKIPWTYPLITAESKKKHSISIKKAMEKKNFQPPIKIGKDLIKMVQSARRICPFRDEIATENLGENAKPKYPLTLNPDGELETKTDRETRLRAKKGSLEYHLKMINRPQCKKKVNSS